MMTGAENRAAAKRKPRDTIVYVGAFQLPDYDASAQRVVANGLILEQLGYRVVLVGVARGLEQGEPFRRTEVPGTNFECWESRYPASKSEWLKRITGLDGLPSFISDHFGERLAGIICYDFPAIAQERLRRLCAKSGAFAIAEATEWYSQGRFSSLRAAIRNIDIPLRMRWINRRMDGVIGASDFLRDYYRSAGVPSMALPTLMSQDLTGEAPDATPDGEPKRLFFAGNGFDPATIAMSKQGPKDRLDKVIAALSHAAGAEFELNIFGVELDDYLAVVPDHADMLQALGARVRFHGRRPRDEVRAELARSDFSIFLRKDNIVTRAGFPTKFAESIHFGTPVITNAVGSLVNFQKEGQTGYFISYDNAALAGQQLRDILSLPAGEVARMKKNCQASQLFHYRSHVDSVAEFMSRVGKG